MHWNFQTTGDDHPPAERVRSRPLRIFVVENHPDTLVCFSLYLEALGHAVTAARNTTEAVALWPHAHCDMLISDLRLPDGNGWDLLGRLHIDPPIYTVAISGLGTAADRARSRDAGFRQHLLKPFKLADLDALLREAAREAAPIFARNCDNNEEQYDAHQNGLCH